MSSLSGSRVLVTGGAGFIGSHIVDDLLLEDVSEVIVYDNFIRGSEDNLVEAMKDPRVKIYKADVLSVDILEKAMLGIDYVFHTAALWILHCEEYQRSAFNTNIEGTFNVLDMCVRNNVKKLVYSSSASVYGTAVITPMEEDHPYCNKTFYGATKIAGEHMCRAFWYKHGLAYIALRYMNVYGNRQDYLGAYINVIMRMIDNTIRGIPLVIHGDGKQVFDFVHVRDISRANILSMKSSDSDECINVGTEVGTSLRDLAQIVLEIFGSEIDIEYKEDPHGSLVTYRIGSNKKAEKLLGYSSSVELREGLEELVEWRKINHNLIEKRREARDRLDQLGG